MEWMKAVWPKVLDRTPNASSAFWKELYNKKFGLYGQWGDTAVPGKLVRHPWSLRAAEFKNAFETIIVDGVSPSSVVNDDRSHVSAILGGTAGLLALGGLAGPIAAIPSVVVGAVAGGIALGTELQSISEEAKVKKNMAAFAEIYKREARYRALEVPSQVASATP